MYQAFSHTKLPCKTCYHGTPVQKCYLILQGEVKVTIREVKVNGWIGKSWRNVLCDAGCHSENKQTRNINSFGKSNTYNLYVDFRKYHQTDNPVKIQLVWYKCLQTLVIKTRKEKGQNLIWGLVWSTSIYSVKFAERNKIVQHKLFAGYITVR